MTRKRTTIAFTSATLGLAALLSMQALAQPRDGRPPTEGPRARAGDDAPRRFDGAQRRGNPVQRMMNELEMTDEQKDKAKDTLAAHQAKVKTWNDAHRAELDKIEKQMQALREKRQKLMESAPRPADALASLRPILTAEQQAKLDARLEEMRNAPAPGSPAGRRPGEMGPPPEGRPNPEARPNRQAAPRDGQGEGAQGNRGNNR